MADKPPPDISAVARRNAEAMLKAERAAIRLREANQALEKAQAAVVSGNRSSLESLLKVEAALHKVKSAAMQNADAQAKLSDNAQKSAKSHKSLSVETEGFVTKLNQGIGVVKSFTDVVIGLGRAVFGTAAEMGRALIEQAAFYEGTRTTLDAVLRDQGPGAGRSEFGRTLQLAPMLPGDVSDISRSRTAIATAGFHARAELDTVSSLVEDLAALQPTRAAEIRDSVVRSIAEVRSANRGSREQVRELMHAGVNVQELYAGLARRHNLQGSQASQVTQVENLLRTRQIKGNEFINATIEAVQKTTGKQIGQFAIARGGDSLDAVLSNIKAGPVTMLLNLFHKFDGAAPGMMQIKNTLKAISELFDATTPRGARLAGMLERLLRGVAGRVNFAGIVNTLDTVLDVVEGLASAGTFLWDNIVAPFGSAVWGTIAGLMPVISAAISNIFGTNTTQSAEGWRMIVTYAGKLMGFGLVTIFTAVLVAVKALATVWHVMVPVVATVAGWIEKIVGWLSNNVVVRTFQAAADIGSKIGAGLVAGMGAVRGTVAAAGADLAHDAVTGTETTLAIRSPSRVFMRLGEHSAEGFAQGMEGSGRPRAGAESMAMGGARGAAGGGSKGPVSLVVNVNVEGGVESGQGARELGDRIGRLLPLAFADMMDQLAMERGV